MTSPSVVFVAQRPFWNSLPGTVLQSHLLAVLMAQGSPLTQPTDSHRTVTVIALKPGKESDYCCLARNWLVLTTYLFQHTCYRLIFHIVITEWLTDLHSHIHTGEMRPVGFFFICVLIRIQYLCLWISFMPVLCYFSCCVFSCMSVPVQQLIGLPKTVIWNVLKCV